MADYRHKGFDLRSVYLNMSAFDLFKNFQLQDVPMHRQVTRPVTRGTLMRDVKAIESKLKEQK